MYKWVLDLLDVDVEDTSKLSQEEFAMIRRNGLGASDMSAVLGTMDKFRTKDDVIQNKLQTTYTDDEKAIGDKVNVRKGSDLEPMILNKTGELLGHKLWKPNAMYRMKKYPWLTVNFDGLFKENNQVIPVEAKFTSTYADKYWNYTGVFDVANVSNQMQFLDFVNLLAKSYGVPPYYLIQVQIQMLATGAQYGYISSLRDKDWTVYPFKVKRNERIIEEAILESGRTWQTIEKLRRN